MTNPNPILPPNDIHKLKELVLKLEPEIGRFGGRYFLEEPNGHQYKLNDIVEIFSKTVLTNEHLDRNEVKDANAIISKIRSLDDAANQKLKEKFFFIKILTKIRQIFNFVFNRDSRLDKIAKKIEQDNASFQLDDAASNHAAPTELNSSDDKLSDERSSFRSGPPKEMIEDELSGDDASSFESVESEESAVTPPLVGVDDEDDDIDDKEQQASPAEPFAQVNSILTWLNAHQGSGQGNANAERTAFIQIKSSLPGSFGRVQESAGSQRNEAVESSVVFDSRIGGFQEVGYYYENLHFLKDLGEDLTTPFISLKGKLQRGVLTADNIEELLDTLVEMSQNARQAFAQVLSRDNNTFAIIEQMEKALNNELLVFQWMRNVLSNNNLTSSQKNQLSRAEARLREHLTSFNELLKRIKIDESAALRSAVQKTKPDIRAACSNLSAFCNIWCNGVNEAMAQEMINKGRELFLGIQDGRVTHGTEDDLLNLTWFLLFKGIEKKEGYEEGTFVVEDPEQKLYKFLLASTGEGGNGQYSRPSTHYVGRSPTLHYGIDIFRPEMPAQKRTLLFAMVKNYDSEQEVLFIKPENYSAKLLYPMDALWHGGEMVIAQRNKLFYPGMDDQENMRKERVPAAVISRFTQLVGKDNKEALANAKKYGIAYMYAYAKKIHSDALDDLVLGYDHLDKRTGREVYLDVDELNN